VFNNVYHIEAPISLFFIVRRRTLVFAAMFAVFDSMCVLFSHVSQRGVLVVALVLPAMVRNVQKACR